MFMLIMQFFWKYIDDLMGKGLEISILLELLFYVSASLIPLALPLAMLLSSIMTMGNLSENNELTALKSSGLSLYRIMRPLTVVVIGISIGTFFFSNYVIPVANLKWRSLIYDIQETKIAAVLSPGKYTSELDGYSIKIDEGQESSFKGIIIHDHTNPSVIKTVRAKSGEIFKSTNGNYLFFNLKDGNMIEELSINGTKSMQQTESGHFYPSRRSKFKDASYKIDLSGFKINRSDEDLFKDSYEMLNVFQLNKSLDSMQGKHTENQRNFAQAIQYNHPFFQKIKLNNAFNKMGVNDSISNLNKNTASTLVFAKQTKAAKIKALSISISQIRDRKQQLEGQKAFLESMSQNVSKYYIEFHRKFALSAAIIVLFFVGAPLGAIIRKGGFGAPVVIAALLFMVYFVIISIGDNLASENVVSPFVGMWMATFVLLPVAIWLMGSAANDSQVFNKDAWVKGFKKLKFRKK